MTDARSRLIIVAALTLGWVSIATAQTASYDGSFRFAQGRYTFDDTVSTSLWLNQLAYSAPSWWLELTVPVVYQDAGSLSYVTGMPMPSGDHGGGHPGGDHPGGGGHGGPGSGGMHDDPAASGVAELGLADPYVKLGAIVYRNAFDTTSLGAFVTVKAPIADQSDGFGTGEWDVGTGLSWRRSTRRFLLFGELAYWRLGDAATLELDDPVVVELGLARQLGESKISLEATVRGRSETIAGIDGPLSVDLTISRASKSAGSVYLMTGAGLSESAPDYSIAIGYRSKIWTRPAEHSDD